MSAATERCLVVALDGLPVAKALHLAAALQGRVWGFKINDMLLEHGIELVHRLRPYGQVFADPKLHDIPNTVRHGVQRLAEAGADLITVHASGGPAMLAAAVAAAGPARILAVTLLTAFDGRQAQQVYGRSTDETVQHLARLAWQAGVHGLVCAAAELPLLEAEFPPGLLRVVPGVRPAWHEAADDQRRTATPAVAWRGGATHLVIGRPICAAADPLAAVAAIQRELDELGDEPSEP